MESVQYIAQPVKRDIWKTSANNSAVILIVAFTLVVGYFISAKSFMACCGTVGAFYSAMYFLTACAAFSPVNLLILSIVSAYTGAEVNDKTIEYSEQWRLAIGRGLIVWVATMAAQGWLDMQKVLDGDQESWFKLALVVMSAALVVGMEPARIAGMLRGKETKNVVGGGEHSAAH